MPDAQPWLIPHWPDAPAGVGALSTTRGGGVSLAPYDDGAGGGGLNLGVHVGDLPGHVLQNRARLRAALPAEPAWLTQVHGVAVADAAAVSAAQAMQAAQAAGQSGVCRGAGVTGGATGGTGTAAGIAATAATVATAAAGAAAATGGGAAAIAAAGAGLTPGMSAAEEGASNRPPLAPEADASIATAPGVVCSVMTADCLPVLFCDRAGSVVAAAHAGWRGLAGGVLGSTVAAMRAAGAGEIVAWLGPAIGPERFEVGAEVLAAFLAGAADDAGRRQVQAAFRPVSGSPGKYLADIYALARHMLRGDGVERVAGGEYCTVKDASRFYSYRRDGVTGRQASLVWLK